MKQMTPIEELRHSASHILATAVLRLFPETKLDIGPPTNTGFYYDFDLDHNFTAQDLESIESEMKKSSERKPEVRANGGKSGRGHKADLRDGTGNLQVRSTSGHPGRGRHFLLPERGIPRPLRREPCRLHEKAQSLQNFSA